MCPAELGFYYSFQTAKRILGAKHYRTIVYCTGEIITCLALHPDLSPNWIELSQRWKSGGQFDTHDGCVLVREDRSCEARAQLLQSHSQPRKYLLRKPVPTTSPTSLDKPADAWMLPRTRIHWRHSPQEVRSSRSPANVLCLLFLELDRPIKAGTKIYNIHARSLWLLNQHFTAAFLGAQTLDLSCIFTKNKRPLFVAYCTELFTEPDFAKKLRNMFSLRKINLTSPWTAH